MNPLLHRIKNQLFSYKYLCLILIFVSALTYMSNIREVMDLTLYDEASQLRDGLNIRRNILPSAQASPIYSIWYAFLSFFIPNTIDIYYVNWLFLTIALPVVVYLLLVELKLNPAISYTISMIFLYSGFNYPLWPKTNNFGLFIIITSALILKKINPSKIKHSVDFYIFLFFIGSFLRPEFLVSGVLYILLNLNNLRIRPTFERLLYFIIAFSFISLFGFPFGNRLTGAFGQHFVVNYVENNNLDIIAWDSYNSIISQVFEGGDNLFEYMLINPQAFFGHMIFNAKRIPVSFLSYFKPFNEETYYVAITTFYLFLIFTFLIFYYKKNIFKKLGSETSIKTFLQNNINKVLISIITPYLITAVLIYPRGHYFLYIFLGMMILIAYNFKNFLNVPFEKSSRIVLFSFILVLFSITHINSQDKGEKYVLEISSFINEYTTAKDISKVTIFSGDGNYCIYVNKNCEHNPNLGNTSDYLLYLESNEIDIIILSQRLLKSNEVDNPGGPEVLVSNLKTLEYEKQKTIWDTEIYVLSR